MNLVRVADRAGELLEVEALGARRGEDHPFAAREQRNRVEHTPHRVGYCTRLNFCARRPVPTSAV